MKEEINTEQFVCQSFYGDDGVLQDCTCGKCSNEKKDCLFQCATRHKTFEDTDLITRKESDELWNKYYKEIQGCWDEFSSPQMCIWINCDSNTDYHTVGKEVDYRDCELEDGHFYRVEKKLIP